MFYRKTASGEIIDFSKSRYSDECVYTDKDIIKAWDGNFYIEGEEPTAPAGVRHKQLSDKISAIAQEHLDLFAQALGYDNCLAACTYTNTGVSKFDAEGEAFRKWRSAVWDKCYDILAEVENDFRPLPSKEELLAELPKLKLVYE